MHLQVFCLLQCRLYLHAVFSDNICIIPPGFIHPVVVEIHFIGKNPAIQGAKAAEGIRRKENPVGFFIGHHNLRPVHHGSKHEAQFVFPD